jgi:hypothetical protein
MPEQPENDWFDFSIYKITEEEGRAFLEEYINRYQAATILPYMELWSEYATQTHMNPNWQPTSSQDYSTIQQNYTATFRLLGRNIYRFEVASLEWEDINLRINGTYRIEYPAALDTALRTYFGGKISMLLIRNHRGGLQLIHLAFSIDKRGRA